MPPKAPAPSVLPAFDVHSFLVSAKVPRRVVRYARGAAVFAQGGVANNVFYVQDGGVKLSVLSTSGKEAVVAMLGPGDFFGEAEMVGTTRSRVNFFMNKFRKLGFIEYNGKLKINSSLLSIVLHD